MTRAALTRALQTVPGARLRGFFFRAIRLKFVATPLSALGSLNGGRYNAAGSFEVYYLAPNADVALCETQAVDPSGVAKRIIPLALFTIDVDLQHVVDLTTKAALRALNVSAPELTTEWRAVTLGGRTPITHEIGAAARKAEIEALLYPSARVDGAANLAVIVDRLRRGSTLSINPAEGFGSGTTIEVNGTR